MLNKSVVFSLPSFGTWNMNVWGKPRNISFATKSVVFSLPSFGTWNMNVWGKPRNI